MHEFNVAQIPSSRAVKRNNFEHSKLKPYTVHTGTRLCMLDLLKSLMHGYKCVILIKVKANTYLAYFCRKFLSLHWMNNE